MPHPTQISEKDLLAASQKLEHQGFAILPDVFSQREIVQLKSTLDKSLGLKENKIHSQRRLLQAVPKLKKVLFNNHLLRIIHHIQPDAFLVKSIYFDKTPETNWFVTWHQDIPINVSGKKEADGFSRWTFKEGIHSVCPPEEYCKNIFTLRIHLDDTDELNGALKVLPGSHQKHYSDSEIAALAENSQVVNCLVDAGGLMAMKPLLLHASGKSKNQKGRQVIHLEFASLDLPDGLDWLEKEIC